MATNTRREAFLATLEYTLDEQGKKHYIYPMKLKNIGLVQELFTKFNDEFPILNLPTPLLDEEGKVVLSEDDEEIMDTTAYDAMMEVLELALMEDTQSIESWIDLQQIEDILAKYRRVSGLLKKKMEMESQMALLGTSL